MLEIYNSPEKINRVLLTDDGEKAFVLQNNRVLKIVNIKSKQQQVIKNFERPYFDMRMEAKRLYLTANYFLLVVDEKGEDIKDHEGVEPWSITF